jgi:putative transposase
MRDAHLSKTAQATLLGVSRSTLYYQKTKPPDEWRLKCRIEKVLREFPAYGYRRLAIHLKENGKRVRRVMKLFGIKLYRRRGRKWKKPKNNTGIYPNLLMFIQPRREHYVWVADFTHLSWQGRDIAVATVMDVYTRTIVGIAVGTRHGRV